MPAHAVVLRHEHHALAGGILEADGEVEEDLLRDIIEHRRAEVHAASTLRILVEECRRGAELGLPGGGGGGGSRWHEFRVLSSTLPSGSSAIELSLGRILDVAKSNSAAPARCQ